MGIALALLVGMATAVPQRHMGSVDAEDAMEARFAMLERKVEKQQHKLEKQQRVIEKLQHANTKQRILGVTKRHSGSIAELDQERYIDPMKSHSNWFMLWCDAGGTNAVCKDTPCLCQHRCKEAEGCTFCNDEQKASIATCQAACGECKSGDPYFDGRSGGWA